jgi:hypothetical protein
MTRKELLASPALMERHFMTILLPRFQFVESECRRLLRNSSTGRESAEFLACFIMSDFHRASDDKMPWAKFKERATEKCAKLCAMFNERAAPSPTAKPRAAKTKPKARQKGRKA